MMESIKRAAKRKSVIGIFSIFVVTGTVFGIQQTEKTPPPQYILAPVTKGSVIVSLKGSGQVSGENQLDIKPLVSGKITAVNMKQGQTVKAGDVLATIDDTEPQKSIRDVSVSVSNAQISLQSAQIALEKITKPADALSVTQAQNQVNQAKRALDTLLAGPNQFDLTQAENDLAQQEENARISDDGKSPVVVRKAYDSAVPALKSVAQTLQQALYDADSVIGVDNTLANDSYEQMLSALDSSKLLNAKSVYPSVKASVNAFKTETDALASLNQDTASIDAALLDGQKSIDQISTLLQNVYDALLNTPTSASFSSSNLQSLENTIQGDRTNVSSKMTIIVSQTQGLSDAKESYKTLLANIAKSQTALDKLKSGATTSDIAAAKEKVTEAQQAYDKLLQGADQLDVLSAQNSIAQRRMDLVSAQQKLSDARDVLNEYTIRAPFDGTIGNLTAKTGDQAAPSTALAAIITDAKIAPISLNEVDASKVRVGDKAMLTFDALPDLSIAGVVSEINPIGTVSQGVVNYNIKIAFQTQDERVKPGMGVSASVITEMKTDVLTVSNAAIKSQNGQSVVMTLPNVKNTDGSQQTITTSDSPVSKPIQTGLSNDESTEITGGLNEGDMVIIRTIDTSKKTTTAASQSNGLRVQGLGGFTGGGGNAGFGGTGAVRVRTGG